MGGMALYEGILAALDALQAARHRKRVLVLLTDGNDRAVRHEGAGAFRSTRDRIRQPISAR